MARTVPFAFTNNNENGTNTDRFVMKIASWDDMTNACDEFMQNVQNTGFFLYKITFNLRVDHDSSHRPQ